jgi:IclR family transcriptional regulator, KDG regulon repressor
MLACPVFITPVRDFEQVRTVNAIARAADILELLASATEPVRMSGIATAIGIPRNSVYEIVNTLAARRLVQIGDDGRVGLGSWLFELGSRYAQSVDLLGEARTTASRVRDASGETVHVATLDGRHALYLIKEESRHLVRMSSAIGLRLPAHVSGVGKAMLAALPGDELERRFAGVALERLTPNSLATFAALERDLAATRIRGYALDHEESSPEVRCVAAALQDARGDVIAGMSISVPVSRMSPARERELADLVIRAVDDLGVRLGYRVGGSVAAAG